MRMPFVFMNMKFFSDRMEPNAQGNVRRVMRGGEIEMGMSWVWLPQKQMLRQDLTSHGLFGRKSQKATVREKGSEQEREGSM